MFTHTFSRTAIGALLAAILLVPAAQADNWAQDRRTTIDPAIVAAIHDRATLQPEPVALDPAIHAALVARTSAATRPDDRAGTRGVGALPQPAEVATDDSFAWNKAGIGVSAALALLLAFGLLVAARRSPTRATSA